MKLPPKFNQIVNALFVLGLIALLFSTSARRTVASTMQSWALRLGLFDAQAEAVDSLGTVERNFPLVTLDGAPLDPATLAGKPVFLHVWASWCPPCIAEFPDIQKLVASVPAEEVAFLLVTVDRNPEKAREFLEKKGYSLPVYQLTATLPPEIQYNAIPTTYLIDTSGKIVYKHEGLAQYNNDDFRNFLLKID